MVGVYVRHQEFAHRFRQVLGSISEDSRTKIRVVPVRRNATGVVAPNFGKPSQDNSGELLHRLKSTERRNQGGQGIAVIQRNPASNATVVRVDVKRTDYETATILRIEEFHLFAVHFDRSQIVGSFTPEDKVVY